MPKLVFKIASDWEEVVRLRNEIAKLKQELKGMDSTQSPAAFKALNTQLFTSTQRMNELVTDAAKAGAVIEGDFKKKIFDTSQVVNGFTEKILAQKAVVKDIEADVKRLGDAYRIALKRNPLSANGKLEEYNAARKALDEEKAALFGLTQQQAEARLSVKKLRDEYALYNDNAKEIVESNNGIAISWKKALAVIGGAGVLKALGSEMIRIRGEFQSMQTAIETMVGKDIAGQLIPQIKELAKISPLTMSDMVGAEKMMLGFNIQAEDTIKYLKAISDISMGESSKFNSLTLAFSQMSAAGKLMGQDLNQMINAGFNPLQIISEKTGKSIATLKDEMSKGAVSAKMVQQAFIDATSAGGKFYNMSENASKTINGQLSMMQDAMDAAFNEIGQKSEGVIMKGIQVTTSLIENYETVGKVLAGLITTYGTYRTAVMLVTAAESKHTLVEIGLTNARILARKAQLALNAAMLTNPYVALATVVMGLTTTMWAMSDSTTAAARAQKEYNDIKNAASKKEQEHRQKIEELLTAARDESLATLTRQKSLEELRKEYPKIFEQYDVEKLKLEDILKLKQQINEEDSKQSVQERKNDYISLKQTVSNQQRYLQLFDNPDLRKNMSKSDMQIWRMFAGKQSYVQVREQMEKNSELLKKYQKDVLDDNISAYKANLKNYSKERLEAELELAQSSASKRNGFVVNGMMVKGGDLEGVISSINGALAKKKSPTTYKQDYEKAKKDWDDAKKKLSEIEKDKSKFTSKQYEEAKKRVETTEKAYKNLGGITGSSLTKQDNQTEKLRKQTDKYNALLDKQSLEQQRFAEDLQMEVDEARIKAMDEGSAKTIAEMELNFEKEMQAIDRQKEDALRKKIEDARTAWDANPENKGKSFDATGIELSDNERKHFDELYKAAIVNNEKAYKDLAEHYLSYADERLAIEKKFNDDISILQEARKKAEAKGDASEIAQIDRSVEKRTEVKNEDIFKLDAEQFKQNMDWEQVFGNLDKVSTDTLKKLKANLKDFISSQKDLSPENFKELVDAIERIDDKVSERNPFEAMSVSFKSLKDATDAQREAQEAYNKALEEGTDEEKKNAKATLESAKNSKQKALYEATDALHKGINEIGQYVDAGNQVIGIMETLGIKTPEWLEGTMSGFGEMLDGLGSIDLMKPMSIVTGGLQTIKGALTSITSLGGAINWSGSNAKEVAETINRLTERNEILGKSIDRLTDIMEKSAGSKAISAYEEARKNQQEKNENLLDIAQAQASYHNSHKSWQYYMRWTDEQLKWAQENVDASFTGTNSLWNLTPEQMNKLLSNVNIYEQIKNAGKGGYGGRVMEDLEEYAEQAGKIADLEASINESLMNVSFDSLRSSFLDSLMDMEKDAKGFSDDFSEMMQRALLDFSLGETFDNELKDWYNDVAKSISENSGKLSETQMDDFKKRYDDIVNAAMYERDKIAELTGYTGGKDSTREASQKGIATASQDSVDENNGRLAVMQGHTYSINENVNRMATGIDTIAGHTVNLSCLTSIDKTMQSILSMRDASLTHLSNIDSHTARLEAIESAIVFMKNDINTMLIKGLKLSRN